MRRPSGTRYARFVSSRSRPPGARPHRRRRRRSARSRACTPALAEERVSVELLAPEPHFWYRPLAVAEPFDLGEVRHFELSKLAAEAGATFTPGALVSVDAARRLAYTSPGGAVPYTALLIACGAVPKPAIDGALTFRGPADTDEDRGAARRDRGRRGTASRLRSSGGRGLDPARLRARADDGGLGWKSGVSPVWSSRSSRPRTSRCTCSGERRAAPSGSCSTSAGSLSTHARIRPRRVTGELLLVADGIVVADRVVALPRLQGPRIGGVPQTFEGFIPVDPHGRVTGMSDVYAAGDITTFPVKQGGIAAQQAEAAAEAIAAAAGADVTPRPFRPGPPRPAANRGGAALPPRRHRRRGETRRRARSHSGGRQRRSSAATWLRFSPDSPAPRGRSAPASDSGVAVEVELDPDTLRKPTRPSARGSS